jgi:hypothetical protein
LRGRRKEEDNEVKREGEGRIGGRRRIRREKEGGG